MSPSSPATPLARPARATARVSYAYSVEHLTEAMKRIREFLKENGIISGEHEEEKPWQH